MRALDELLPRPEVVGWPTLLPDHLSPSSLKMWMRCREQWRRRYVLGEKERPGAALVWGTAHNFALVETNFGQKVTTGFDLSVDDVQLAFAEGFDQRIAVEGDEIVWGADTPSEMKDKGVALAAEYHRQVSASVQPIAVEESFSLEVPGVPVPVIGRMDVSETARTIDLKTGNKREMKPDNAFQGRVYQLVRPFPIEFHLATKTKTPGIYTPAEWPEFGFDFSEFVQARTRRVLVDLAQDILATYAQFGPEQVWPGAFTYGWACGYCGFRPTCSYWAEGDGPDPVAARKVVSGSFVAPDPLVLEVGALTRTLLDIGVKKEQGPAFEEAIRSNREKNAGHPLKHVEWLKLQLEKQLAGAPA